MGGVLGIHGCYVFNLPIVKQRVDEQTIRRACYVNLPHGTDKR